MGFISAKVLILIQFSVLLLSCFTVFGDELNLLSDSQISLSPAEPPEHHEGHHHHHHHHITHHPPPSPVHPPYQPPVHPPPTHPLPIHAPPPHPLPVHAPPPHPVPVHPPPPHPVPVHPPPPHPVPVHAPPPHPVPVHAPPPHPVPVHAPPPHPVPVHAPPPHPVPVHAPPPHPVPVHAPPPHPVPVHPPPPHALIHVPPPHPPVHAPPPHPPVKPHPVPHRELVAVQGVVYCKSCKYIGVDTLLGASPLDGAVVRLQCNNTKYPLVHEAKTDKNGYFFILPQKQLTTAGWHKCKASLVSSPLATCKNPTDLHGGLKGALLVPTPKPPAPPSATPGPLKYELFTVGPFAFEPSRTAPCPR